MNEEQLKVLRNTVLLILEAAASGQFTQDHWNSLADAYMTKMQEAIEKDKLANDGT
jgi:hypothetical protein